MRHLSLPPARSRYRVSFFWLTTFFILSAFAFNTARAQSPQLSLADILIGLRSKKATLPERNQILTGAVVERGITFSLTPEIEKELLNTGADKSLVDAIGKKSTVVSAAMVVQPKVEPKPVETKPAPAPTPDAAFYKKRANSYIAKGEFDLAVVDLNQIIDMKAEDASVFVTRAAAYTGRNRYDLAIGDLDKAIELDPKMPAAYLGRGEAYEKSGSVEKAVADYQKVIDLDAANEAAKSGLLRLKPVQARVEPKPVVPDPVTPPAAANNIPETLNVGQIAGSNAKLAMPVYPPAARSMGIQGKVTVQVTLDEEGKVVSVKATSGPSSLRLPSEDAARRSKFTPVKVGEKAVKATGYVVYNFVS